MSVLQESVDYILVVKHNAYVIVISKLCDMSFISIKFIINICVYIHQLSPPTPQRYGYEYVPHITEASLWVMTDEVYNT